MYCKAQSIDQAWSVDHLSPTTAIKPDWPFSVQLFDWSTTARKVAVIITNTVSKSKTCLKWPFWRMQRDNDATDAQQASWSSLAQSVLQFLRDVWGCRDQSCLFYTVACWCTLCGQSGFIAVVSYDFVLCNTWWLFNFNFFHTQCTLSGLCDKQ